MSKEKKEAKKAAKAEKKANKVPMAPETKQTWIQSATALLCTVTVCFSGMSAVNKAVDNMKELAKNDTSVSDSADVAGDTSSDSAAADSSSDAVADDSAATDDSATADDSAAADSDSSGGSSSGSSSSGGSSSNKGGSSDNKGGAKDPTSYSAAEVVNYYNKCLKDSYAKKVTVKKTETINIKVEKASGGDIVKNFVNNTILPKYAGTKTFEKTFVGGKSGDESLEGYASPAGLAAGDAASAKITKSGANYVITIKTKAEASTLENAPRINKTCAHPLDLASVDIAPAKVTKADFSYPGTTLTATVDATGKVLKTAINQPLSGTGEGKLGITLSATLSGSLEQSCEYKY